MVTDSNDRKFFAKTRRVYGERMEDYGRKSKKIHPTASQLEQLEVYRQKNRDLDQKRKIIFRITTVLFGLIFLYVFLRLAASDIVSIFY